MSAEDWDNTPSTTNMGEAQHHWTKSRTGGKLFLVEAIQSGRKLDESVAHEIEISIKVLVNSHNESSQHCARNLTRQSTTIRKSRDSHALADERARIQLEIDIRKEEKKRLDARVKELQVQKSATALRGTGLGHKGRQQLRGQIRGVHALRCVQEEDLVAAFGADPIELDLAGRSVARASRRFVALASYGFIATTCAAIWWRRWGGGGAVAAAGRGVPACADARERLELLGLELLGFRAQFQGAMCRGFEEFLELGEQHACGRRNRLAMCYRELAGDQGRKSKGLTELVEPGPDVLDTVSHNDLQSNCDDGTPQQPSCRWWHNEDDSDDANADLLTLMKQTQKKNLPVGIYVQNQKKKRKGAPNAEDDGPPKKLKMTELTMKPKSTKPKSTTPRKQLNWADLPAACPAVLCIDFLPAEPVPALLSLFNKMAAFKATDGRNAKGSDTLFNSRSAIEKPARNVETITAALASNADGSSQINDKWEAVMQLFPDPQKLRNCPIWTELMRTIDYKLDRFSRSKEKSGHLFERYSEQTLRLVEHPQLENDELLENMLCSTISAIVSKDFALYHNGETSSYLIVDDLIRFVLIPFVTVSLIAEDLSFKDFQSALIERNVSNDFRELFHPEDDNNDIIHEIHRQNVLWICANIRAEEEKIQRKLKIRLPPRPSPPIQVKTLDDFPSISLRYFLIAYVNKILARSLRKQNKVTRLKPVAQQKMTTPASSTSKYGTCSQTTRSKPSAEDEAESD
ncbi:hypothetical protein C8J57DRAFT_1259340 [Mycena rebaudengoi]|nr:hypothetical protein C8J57DRAFT_1259340 [Mycena rebaudengoi]